MEQRDSDRAHEKVRLAKKAMIDAIDRNDEPEVARILAERPSFRPIVSAEILRTEEGSIPVFAYAVERRRLSIAMTMLKDGVVNSVAFRRAIWSAARQGDARMLNWLLTHAAEKLPHPGNLARALESARGLCDDPQKCAACDAALRPVLLRVSSEALRQLEVSRQLQASRHSTSLSHKDASGHGEFLGAIGAVESSRPILHLPKLSAARPEVAE